MRSEPSILHADLDAFYASVEQLLDPNLRGRPIAVGGSGTGGVVLAASYEARALGVRSPMPGWQAKRLCPQLIFVSGHFGRYIEFSERVMSIFADFTPHVEQISIDEAFLDVAGATRLFGDPPHIAEHIRTRVRDEVGLPVSVGVATTKHLAKIASQVAKPDGLKVVPAGSERSFLDPLPVGLVWGIGVKTQARLHDRGIFTIGQLAEAEPAHLAPLLGSANSTKLHDRANNHDERAVRHHGKAKSVGAQSALGRQTPTPELVREVVGHLADRVLRRMRKAQLAGRTVTVRVRFANMRAVTRSRTLDAPIATTLTVTEVAEALVHDALADHPSERDVSLLAVSITNLAPQATLQLEFAVDPDPTADALRPGSAIGHDRWAVDQAMDIVRNRFGTDAVGYLSVATSRHAQVPDEFRELAERELGH